MDRDLPTSVRWIVSKTGVLVCRDTPDGETTVTRCTRLTPSEGILELEVPEHVWLPKGAQTPVWVDRNGDDHPDRCWIMPATADEQQRFISVPATATYQQELAFVRLSRQSPPKGYTQCALSNGTSWEKPVASTLTYVGYEGMRYWGDVNGDGREDFCRVVDAERMTMLCTESFPSGDRDTLDLLENRGRNRF